MSIIDLNILDVVLLHPSSNIVPSFKITISRKPNPIFRETFPVSSILRLLQTNRKQFLLDIMTTLPRKSFATSSVPALSPTLQPWTFSHKFLSHCHYLYSRFVSVSFRFTKLHRLVKVFALDTDHFLQVLSSLL